MFVKTQFKQLERKFMFTFSDKSREPAIPWLLMRFQPNCLRNMSKFLDAQVFDLVWRNFRLHLVEFSTGLLDDHSLADVKLICDGGEVSEQRDKC